MKPSAYNDNCGCRIATCSVKEEKQAGLWRYMAFFLPGLIIWAVLYHFLAPAAKWLTYSLFGLAPESHLASAVEFFFFDTPKVLMLLTLIVFGVGIIRSFFTPERSTRQILACKREFIGNALAFMMAVITLSLPEFITLRKVLKSRLIAVVICVVGAGIIMVGYMFNILPIRKIMENGTGIYF